MAPVRGSTEPLDGPASGELSSTAERLIDVAAVLGAALTIDEVARAIVQEARRMLDASAGALCLPQAGGVIRVAASFGYPEEAVREFAEFPSDAPLPAADAIRTGTPVILQDRAARLEAYPEVANLSPYRGGMVAWPLRYGNRVIGCLGFSFEHDHVVDFSRRVLIEALAELCAQALERARLYEAERTARTEAEALRGQAELLFELAGAANRASQLSELYPPALEAIIKGLNVERAAVLLSDADGIMRFKAWRGLSTEYRAAVEGHSPWCADTLDPKPIVVADVRAEESLACYAELFEAEAIGGLAFVPLVHEGRLLGKLMLYSRTPRVFDERELRLASAIATPIAQAAARATLFEREKRARAEAECNAEQMRRLQLLTAELSGAPDVERICEIVIDHGSAVLGALTAALWLVDGAEGVLRLARSSRYPPALREEVARMPLTPGTLLADALERSEPIWFESRGEYARAYPELEALSRRHAVRPDLALAVLPLSAGEEWLGVCAFSFPEQTGITREQRTFLRALGQQASQALERGRLYQAQQAARAEAEESQRRASFLAQASALLSGTLDYEITLERVARLAVPAIGDWCVVDLEDESHGALVTAAIAHAEPDKVAVAKELRRRYPLEEGPGTALHVFRTGISLLAAEVSEAELARSARDEIQLALLREIGMGSVIMVPVSARGRVFGVLTLVASQQGRYRNADLQMAEQLGRRIGVAVDNARLYQQAIEAIALRDDFLSVAGHELRTPLTALLLQSDLLLGKFSECLGDAAELQAPLQRLQRNARRLAKLVDELLDVSRITAGRLELDRVEMDLAGLVEEVVLRSSEQVRRAGCPLELDLRGPVVGVWDRFRLEQVVTNLLSNALKYGGRAPIEVRLACSGPEARLSVKDHGIGIAPRDQVRIFERFERSVSPREYGGLGLGLWIVRQIVEAHGGSVGVRSQLGSGSEFWVELPLLRVGASRVRGPDEVKA